MEHASFHQETYGDTFAEFIIEHYITDQLNQNNEHKEHQDLPFKQDHNTCQHSVETLMLHVFSFELKT